MRRREVLTSALAVAATLAGCQQRDPAGTTTRTTASEQTATTAPPTTEPETATASPTAVEGPIGGEPGPLPDAAWPQPHRAPSKTAYLPSGPGFTDAPAVDWTRDPEGVEGSYSPAFKAPVVDDDELYTVTAQLFGPEVPAPEEHSLNALTPDGGERWTAPLAADDDSTAVPTAPALYDDVVLVGVEHEVQAFDRTSGERAWTVALEDGPDGLTPTAERAYVRAHRSISAVTSDGSSWTTPFDEYPGTLAVGSDAVYVTTSRRLHRLEPASGVVRWTRELPAVDGGWAVDRLLAVEGGVLARQNSGDLYAYTAGGEEVWRTSGTLDALATDGRTVFAGAAGGGVRALRVADGEDRWVRPCEAISGCGIGHRVIDLAATADAVYLSLEDQLLAALGTGDGAVRWTRDTPEMVERVVLTPDALYGVGDSHDPLVRFAG